MLKVELHAHSIEDPEDPIPHTSHQLIDRAVALGYDALAITLHNRQLDLADLAPYAADRGLTLIRGIERSIGPKHVLLVNFSRASESVSSFADLARLKADEPDGLVIAPHPFFPGSSCLGRSIERHAPLFDAIEWNGMFTPFINFNRRAAGWARRHRKPVVGNGDIHRLHQLGTCYSLVDAEPEPSAICAAIKRGDLRVEASPISFLQATLTMSDLVSAQLWMKAGLVLRPADRQYPAQGRTFQA